MLKELKTPYQKTYVGPFSIGLIYFGLKEFDTAIDWFEKMIDGRDAGFFHMSVSPTSDPLRSYPRCKALLRKMNLEP